MLSQNSSSRQRDEDDRDAAAADGDQTQNLRSQTPSEALRYYTLDLTQRTKYCPPHNSSRLNMTPQTLNINVCQMTARMSKEWSQGKRIC